MTCRGTTRKGTQCQREATHGEWCYPHSPATRDEAAETQRRGYQAMKAKEAAPPIPQSTGQELGNRHIETKQDCARLQVDMAQALLRGELDRRVVNAVAIPLKNAMPGLPDAVARDGLTEALDEVPYDAEELSRIEAKLRDGRPKVGKPKRG